jgi:hypothetical protein
MSGCILSLIICRENHIFLRRILLSSAARLAVPYVSTLTHKKQDFRVNVSEHKMYVLIFSTTSV